MQRDSKLLVRMSGIGKRFGNVQVLRDVNLEINSGEVLVLAGENGAGKSTLIKILGAVHTDYDGVVELEGRLIHPTSPRGANDLGIAVIFQELSLVPSMSVADNIFLGRSITRAGFVEDRTQEQRGQELLDHLGIDIDVRQWVEDLPVALQQLTEISKALAQNARVLVMDEPTSSLNAPEVEKLFGLIQDLKSRGCGIVYITHKMEEIERIADRITVLRDGSHVGTDRKAAMPPERLLQLMVGRDVAQQFPRHQSRVGEERLRLENFSVADRLRPGRWRVKDVSLGIRAGEILGVAGLQGSGASDLFLALFGAYGKATQGRALLNGRPLAISAPARAIAQGVALLTNDRKATGLVLSLPIVANATLADLRRFSPWGWRQSQQELEATRAHAATLSLRAASLEMEVGALSGGNQQKVALAKWLQTEPQLLLLDEPTRGIDVGAKHEIYQLLNTLTASGISILLITSELPELLAMSDRIVVMHRGQLTAEFTREHATAERILEAAMGDVQVMESQGLNY